MHVTPQAWFAGVISRRRTHLVVALLIAAVVLAPGTARGQGAKAQPQAVVKLPPHPLFEGIALSAAQQQRVDAIRARAMEEARTLQLEARPTIFALMAARHRHDTAAVARYTTEAHAKRELLRELLARERSELRAVVGAEQRGAFDQNKSKLDAMEASIAPQRGR